MEAEASNWLCMPVSIFMAPSQGVAVTVRKSVSLIEMVVDCGEDLSRKGVNYGGMV